MTRDGLWIGGLHETSNRVVMLKLSMFAEGPFNCRLTSTYPRAACRHSGQKYRILVSRLVYWSFSK